jgi:predicted DsbA family dithiol-disulfide isomerase
LRAIATELELPQADVDRLFAEDLHADRVAASTREAVSIGANAVPAFVLDRRLLVLGAQPEGVFEQAFARLERLP